MKLQEASDLAGQLLAELGPGLERGVVAGSILRQKPEVKDAELVLLPRLELWGVRDLFGEIVETVERNCLEIRLEDLINFSQGKWVFDPVLRRNGPRYKRLRHVPTGLCCDLFITTPAGWGGALAIRTGPAEFSQALVTLALKQGKHVGDGYLIHNHRKEWGVIRGEKKSKPCPRGAGCSLIVPTHEEPDFFTALGLRWLEPWERTEAALRTAAGGQAQGALPEGRG